MGPRPNPIWHYSGPEEEKPDQGTLLVRERYRGSLTFGTLLSLRDLLVGGEIPAGERVPEKWVARRLGVSRTPVRAALAKLAEEGMLEPLAGGGYAMKSFSEDEAFDAIELRGNLEGLAARRAAERGVTVAVARSMEMLVRRMQVIVSTPEMSSTDFAAYVSLNQAFHDTLASAGGLFLAHQIARARTIPFAHASAFVMAEGKHRNGRDAFARAQRHHWLVLDAVLEGRGFEAEAVMREHAEVASQNLRLALRNQEALRLVVGGHLIRGSRRDPSQVEAAPD